MLANHEYGVQADDAEGITAATMRARAELNEIVNRLRKLGGCWKNLKLMDTSSRIGTREGRRIHGLYTVTSDDLRGGARHDDAVCRVLFGVDVHAPKRDAPRAVEQPTVRSRPYDIPLRALIARDVDGLMMAGRCISGDFYAHASYRVTGNSAVLGEAAGRTAAAAARTDRLPQEVGVVSE
jgi:hypothetical protein